MEEDWVLGSAKSYRKRDAWNTNLIQLIPVSANKYDLLHNLNEDDELTKLGKKYPRISNTTKDTLIKERPRCADSKWKYKNKVLIIGDSHVKKIAAELRSNLDDSYEIMGFTKPGALMGEILETAAEEVARLGKKDILVLWAGANDISKNNIKEALRSLIKFMEGHKKVNMISIQALHRHDLQDISCVNKEVIKFNRQVKKILKPYPNVKLMEVEAQRHHFTRHGQHLNLLGKELVASELAKQSLQLLTMAEMNPIQMHWTLDDLHGKYSSSRNANGESIVANNEMKSVGSNKYQGVNSEKCKKSMRIRRTPITKSNDFLW
jgi:pheromone shutdown protein TraB